MGKGINRFESPVKDQYVQTYVDQYVPAPFELMQRKAEAEQKKFDTVQNNWDVLNQKMGERLLKADNPLMAEQMGTIQTTVDNALKEADGDWRKLNREIVNASGAYNKWIKTGLGAEALVQKKKMADNLKAIQDSKMGGDMKVAWANKLEDDYNTIGGVVHGGQVGDPILYDVSELQKTAQTMISQLKLDKDSNAYVNIDDKQGLLITGFEDKGDVSKERIRQLSGMMKNHPEFQAMVESEYAVKQPNMTKQDFADYRFAQMFSGLDANAYVEEKNRIKAKETTAAKEKAKKKKKYTPVTPKISKMDSFQYDPNAEFVDEDKDIVDDPLNTIMTNNANEGKNLVNGTLKDIYFKNNVPHGTTAENKEAFESNIAKWMTDHGVEVGKDGKPTDENYNDFIKFVATADDISSTNSLFNGNSAQQKIFRDKAKASYKNILRRNQLFEEAEQQLKSAGIVVASENAVKQNETGLINAIDAYYAKKHEGMEIDADYMTDLKQIIFEDDPTFFTAGGKNYKAKQVLNEIKHYNASDDKSKFTKSPEFIKMAEMFENLESSRDILGKKGDDDYYKNKINAILTNRMKGGSISIPESNQTNVKVYNRDTGKYEDGILSSDKLYKDFLKPKAEAVANMKMLDGTGKEVRLGDYITKTYGKLKPNEVEGIKAGILKSGMFTDVVDPVTGNMEVVFSDSKTGKKFRMPINIGGKGTENTLGIGEGELKLTKTQQAKMKLWGDVQAAKMGYLEYAPAGDPELGVSIHSKKRGLMDDDGATFDDALATNGNYNVSINPRKLGLYIPGPKGNTTLDRIEIPNDQAANVLLTYQSILDGNISEAQKQKYAGMSNHDIAKLYLRRKVESIQRVGAPQQESKPFTMETGGMGRTDDPVGSDAYTKKKEAEEALKKKSNEQVIYKDAKFTTVPIKDFYGNDVKLKKPVADALIVANTKLKDQGVDIKIADNYVSSDVKVKAYNEYKAQLKEYNSKGYYTKNGQKIKSKPPKQAGSKSFHSHGQAIDLQQIASMKNEVVFQALRDAGFKQHPNEWWHWSIGEFTHDHDHG